MRFEARRDGAVWDVWHVATNRIVCGDLAEAKAMRLAKQLHIAWLYQDITEADFDTPLYAEFLATIKPIIAAARGKGSE